MAVGFSGSNGGTGAKVRNLTEQELDDIIKIGGCYDGTGNIRE